MVPWLAASTPSAPYRALTMHMDVSTLPATTDAGGCGFSMEAGGMTMSIGFSQPVSKGASTSKEVRSMYRLAATAMEAGVLKLLVNCADGPEQAAVTDCGSG